MDQIQLEYLTCESDLQDPDKKGKCCHKSNLITNLLITYSWLRILM